MKTKSVSPTGKANKYVPLSFYDALREVVKGKRVTKLEWANKDEYGFLRAELLHIHRNGADHLWTVSLADMNGDDYVVLS